MAFDWPTTLPSPREADMWTVSVNAVNQSINSIRLWVIPRYSYNRCFMQWNNLQNHDALNLEGHLGRFRGQFLAGKVPHEKYRVKRGTWSGSVSVNGAHTAGATTLAVSGGSGTPQRGDWIMIDKLGSSPRAYQLALVNSATSLVLSRPVVDNLTGGETVSHLGDGSTTLIYDTMVMAQGQEIGPGLAFASPSPPLVSPRAVEFISSYA